jgi:hypothetical protein
VSIRQAAIAEGILCLTSIDTAVTAAASLDPSVRAAIGDVRPLGEWQPLSTSAAAATVAPVSAREA